MKPRSRRGFRSQLTLVLAATGMFSLGSLGAPQRALAQVSGTPKWEVVSVKPRRTNLTDASCAGEGAQPGRLTLPCHTLSGLIGMAYVMFSDGRANGQNNAAGANGRQPIPVEGGPPWIGSDHWEIRAKAEGTPSQEMMRGPMLQELLENRFNLRVHRETRQVPIYTLTVAKAGLRIKEVKGSCAAPGIRGPLAPGQVDCGKRPPQVKGPNLIWDLTVTINQLSKTLDSLMDRPVFDATGVGGIFKVHLEFAPGQTTPALQAASADSATPDNPVGPDIFTALQQQLGLQLEPARGPGVFLVIDHVERPTQD